MMKQLLACTLLAAAVSFGYAQTEIAGNYTGELSVTVPGAAKPSVTTETVSLIAEDGGTYALGIKNFAFGEGEGKLELGDLNVPGITAQEEAGAIILTKEGTTDGPVVEGMTTKLRLSDTNIYEGELALALDVDVYVGETKIMTVLVEFTGTKQASGIASAETDKPVFFVHENTIEVSGTANNYTIFNTAGAMVQHGLITDNNIDIAGLKGGIYIAKIDSHIVKFIKK